jgi:hypothetical protein
MQISPANPLKPLPAIVPPSPFLAISHKGSAKQWGLAVFFVRRTVGGSGFLRKRDLDG